jgi:hypothetical protein
MVAVASCMNTKHKVGDKVNQVTCARFKNGKTPWLINGAKIAPHNGERYDFGTSDNPVQNQSRHESLGRGGGCMTEVSVRPSGEMRDWKSREK